MQLTRWFTWVSTYSVLYPLFLLIISKALALAKAIWKSLCSCFRQTQCSQMIRANIDVVYPPSFFACLAFDIRSSCFVRRSVLRWYAQISYKPHNVAYSSSFSLPSIHHSVRRLNICVPTHSRLSYKLTLFVYFDISFFPWVYVIVYCVAFTDFSSCKVRY